MPHTIFHSLGIIQEKKDFLVSDSLNETAYENCQLIKTNTLVLFEMFFQ